MSQVKLSMDSTRSVHFSRPEKLEKHQKSARHLKKPYTIHHTPILAADSHIMTSDLKDIFSTMMYCLDLRATPKRKPFFKKQYAFSFTSDQAIVLMGDMSLDLADKEHVTTIEHRLPTQAAESLLRLFFEGHLLHCPAERTRSSIDPADQNVILQPSPKGVAIFKRFCGRYGLLSNKRKVPEILMSSFNTMNLIEFDRDPTTDRILHNGYSDRLLFINMMGPGMNFWSAENGPEKVPENLQIERDLLRNGNFEVALNSLDDMAEFLQFGPSESKSHKKVAAPESSLSAEKNREDHPSSELPFFHRFFTSPDSDAHIQYYVSERGARLTRCSGDMFYCLTGKAVMQFLLDCTDVMSKKEAFKVGKDFGQLGVLQQLKRVKVAGKHGIYQLSKEGERIVRWGKQGKSSGEEYLEDDMSQMDDVASDSSDDNVSLKHVLKNPGLKYMFRQFLRTTYCIENLDAYEDIQEFERKLSLVCKSMDKNRTRGKKEDSAEMRRKRRRVVDRLTKECLSKTYAIYGSYLMQGACNEVNIDADLRDDIKGEMNEGYKALMGKESSSHQRGLMPSPIDLNMGSEISTLRRIGMLFALVKKEVGTMLEQDSLAKFRDWPQYRQSQAICNRM